MNENVYDIIYVERMLAAIDEIFEHRINASANVAYKAVLFELITIGESASKIRAEIKEIAPEIPWHRIISLRHRLAHAPHTVDPQAIKEIEKLHLLVLKENLIRLLGELKKQD